MVVQWDSGSRTNYRIGYQGCYDLRILDNAPIGVRHQNIYCNACEKHGIAGMRWKCTICPNYDLCTNCYMADKHDLNHAFERFETSESLGYAISHTCVFASHSALRRAIISSGVRGDGNDAIMTV